MSVATMPHLHITVWVRLTWIGIWISAVHNAKLGSGVGATMAVHQTNENDSEMLCCKQLATCVTHL